MSALKSALLADAPLASCTSLCTFASLDKFRLYMDTEPCCWAGHHAFLFVELLLLCCSVQIHLEGCFLLIFSPGLKMRTFRFVSFGLSIMSFYGTCDRMQQMFPQFNSPAGLTIPKLGTETHCWITAVANRTAIVLIVCRQSNVKICLLKPNHYLSRRPANCVTRALILFEKKKRCQSSR